MPSMIVDPSDLSPLYFRETMIGAGDGSSSWCEDVDDAKVRPYVHPALAVAPSPLHGRGLVALQDIRPGTCLLVTPPVVTAPVNTVLERYTNQAMSSGSSSSSRGLEGVAEQVLLEAIRSEIQAKSLKARSVLSLVGSTNDSDPVLSNFVGATTSIELLTAQDTISTRELLRSDEWCYEFEPSHVSDANLLEIIRRNAFGPDFVGYDRWQHHLEESSVGGDVASFRPFRLLGMYPLAATINHSCVSNAVRSYAGEIMIVHASQPIGAGTEIVWSYVPPIEPQRNDVLQTQYGFRCRCEQCRVQERLSFDQLSFLDDSTRMLLHQLNRRGVSLESLDPTEREALLQLVPMLENELHRSDAALLSNSDKRYFRLGWMYLYLNYLNLAGSARWTDDDTAQQDLVPVIMQMHLAFCASHNASTEHLSVLHLAYEMVATEHTKSTSAAANTSSVTVPTSSSTNKIQFWTRQLQLAHTTRYGALGGDVERIRQCLKHTRGIVRRRDGYALASYRFL